MIEDYLEGAKRHSHIPSDRALAKALEISSPTIRQYRTGRALPSDATMLHLSDLAGIPHDQALLDLFALRSNSEPAKAVIINLKKKLLAAFSVAIAIVALTNTSNAETNTQTQVKQCIHTLYIMENKTVL